MQVSRDERGPQKGIDPDRLKGYARVLNLNYDKLIGILHDSTDVGEDDQELSNKLKAVAAIPGLSDAERHEIAVYVRTHHRPTSSSPTFARSGRKGGAASLPA